MHLSCAKRSIDRTWMVLLGLLFCSASVGATAEKYGDSIEALDPQLVAILAKLHRPNKQGAIGRNKKAYIHARFQRGLHHLAELGLVNGDCRIIDEFVRAANYGLSHQTSSGGFKLAVPDRLKDKIRVHHSDRISGTAFFMASLGLGVAALKTNSWFTTTEDCHKQRAALKQIESHLSSTLSLLIENRDTLQKADVNAPNRLLFNALAFRSLGLILDHETAMAISDGFLNQALELVDQEQGYFIEAGGFDSSYNGVATALALRLSMLNPDNTRLVEVVRRALAWQVGRIDDNGLILLSGNTRVQNHGGESFMGRPKDADAGHTVEALMLGALTYGDAELIKTAEKVIEYYLGSR